MAVLEDIHWADPTTLELLDLLIEAIRPLRVLLVITARPEVRPAWAGRPHVTVQMLSGLDDRTAATLVKQVAGGGPAAANHRPDHHSRRQRATVHRGADQDGA